MFVSYAQNFEDVMLWRALKHVDNGFYLDIGAQDPMVDSVSRGFYEKGWRGVHVEPTSSYAELVRQNRPDETVLQNAVGDETGKIRFFEFPETGLSTGDAEIAAAHVRDGFECLETAVEVISLAAIFDRLADRAIHWMKIDVEGMETSVLTSWGQSNARPWVVVIESTVPLSSERVEATWQHLLTDRGYEMCYFDGLNCYFVADHHGELKDSFKVPPNAFDDFTLSGTATSLIGSLMAGRIAKAHQDLDLSARREDELDEKLKRATAQHTTGLEREVALLDQLNDARRRELDLTNSISESRRQADQLHSQIVYLHRSFSWRFMAPYRVLSRLAKRLPHLTAAFPQWLTSLVKRCLRFLFRHIVKNVQGNPRLYNLARRMINRNPVLRKLATRILLISRGKAQQIQSSAVLPLTPSMNTSPRRMDLTEEELAPLSHVGRIRARQIDVR